MQAFPDLQVLLGKAGEIAMSAACPLNVLARDETSAASIGGAIANLREGRRRFAISRRAIQGPAFRVPSISCSVRWRISNGC
jgi:hypothetical protein